MLLVSKNEMNNYIHLFDKLQHSIPIVHSVFEEMYDGYLYVNNLQEPKYALLFTIFDFHYLVGEIEKKDLEDIEKTIFVDYMKLKRPNELILQSDSSLNDKALTEIFKNHSDIVDKRHCYLVEKDEFIEKYYNETFNENIERRFEKDEQSKQPYLSYVMKDKGNTVSYAKAFMIGKNEAEIDVFTEKSHQRKGYARQLSFKLVKELLKQGITPNWTTWPFRKESQLLALRIGFKHSHDITSFIWVKKD